MDKPVRYWSRSGLNVLFSVFAIFGLAFGGWLVWAGATANYGHATPSFVKATAVSSVVFGVLIVGLVSVLFAGLLRPSLIVTAEDLRIPRLFRTTTIALGDVVGVGLVYKRNSGGGSKLQSGWYLTVWRGNGDEERTGISLASFVPDLTRWSGATLPARPDSFDPVADTRRDSRRNGHAGALRPSPR